MVPCGPLVATLSAVLLSQNRQLQKPLPSIPCDLAQPKSCAAGPAPPHYSVHYVTTAGNFTVDVTTSWAPPYAERFWLISRIGYHTNAPFYRVDYLSAQTNFVVQFGYRGVPKVDALWDQQMTENATWSVHAPGNIRGTVAASMNAAPPPAGQTAPILSIVRAASQQTSSLTTGITLVSTLLGSAFSAKSARQEWR